MEPWDVEKTLQPYPKTLVKLYNKSHEGFILSKCPKNASMDQKAKFKALV
jgi:hypothetical protein